MAGDTDLNTSSIAAGRREVSARWRFVSVFVLVALVQAACSNLNGAREIVLPDVSSQVAQQSAQPQVSREHQRILAAYGGA